MARKLYGEITYDARRSLWVLRDLPPHVAMRLKQIFTKLSPTETNPFRITDTDTNAADIQWFMERYPLKISLSDKRRLNRDARRFYQHQVEAERILMPDAAPTERPGLKPGQALRRYQKQAIDLAEKMKSLIILDDVGLGKTYEGLGLALMDNALPLVIVCQPHLQTQWREKAEKFIDLTVHAPQGNTPYSLPASDIYIFKYTQLAGWIDTLCAGWVRAIAFDEIQELRHGDTTGKGAAAEKICQAVRNAEGYMVGLTATLIYNYGVEAFNIVNMLRPGVLGSRDQFMREYCDMTSGKGIVKDPSALGSFLQEALMVLRRTKSDVGQEAKQEAPYLHWVNPNERAVTEAEELAASLAITTLTGSFQEAGMASREFDMRMREMTGIAKAHEAAAFTRMLVESGQPVVLFGWHREVYEIWNRELADLKPAMYTGSETTTQKEQSKKAFIDGETDILIMSLRSGAGTDGIQYRSSTLVYGELDFSPLVHKQCGGRLDRDGQPDPVYAYYVVTNFGSDPVLIDILGLKQSQSDGIHDPGVTTEREQSDPDRIKRMARAYLESKGIEIPQEKDHQDTEETPTEDQLALI
ncbi:MAG: putative helicase [Marinobacter sp. T13-3]|nr:MAG: putative helicase [Marinobacter sp. T13-3]